MKSIVKLLIVSLLITSSISAKEGDWYAGVQLNGLSVKRDISNNSTLQGIVNFWGYGYDVNVLAFTGRYIRKVRQRRFYNLYWVAGAGVVAASSNNSSLGTAFHVEGGIGAEYDIRGIDRGFIPLFISGELDAGFVSVSGYGGAGLGINIGLHYKF